jgi:hypothetical protein
MDAYNLFVVNMQKRRFRMDLSYYPDRNGALVQQKELVKEITRCTEQ